jgi:phospholipid-binding lipoprotein MlaA
MKRNPSLLLALLALCLTLAPVAARAGADDDAEPGSEISTSETEDDNDVEPGSETSTPETEDDDDLFELLDEELSDVEEKQEISDPMFFWNKMWFQVNDKLHFGLVKPAAVGWKYLLYPRAIRVGIRNLFDNLAWPQQLINCLVQGRFKAAGRETGRFLIDTLVGGIGLWNPSKKIWGIEPEERDGDQSLAKAGMGMGWYVTFPLSGPTSGRGLLGMLLDVINPVSFIPGGSTIARINELSLATTDRYESVVRASVNPYVAVRDGYVQLREKKAAE